MNYQTLLFETKDGIAFVTVNRPDKLNALNDQVMLELGKAAESITTEPEIRGAILTGAGPKSFVAGADIGDLARQGPFDGKARAQRGQGVLRRLETCGQPVIAAKDAYRIGLVNKVVPGADLLAESERMMRGILAMGPLAVRLAMEAVDQGLEMTLDEGLLLEANHFGLLAATQDTKEGLTAFLEKRSAKFQGR